MILRRVIGHFRKQEWTAIALDFFIVVFGVFVGIQVSNWNDAQRDEERALNYLERIRDDLDADLHGYENRVRFWSEVSAFGQQGLAFADESDSNTKQEWTLLLAYFQASQIGDFNTTAATYEELKSAGELRLISDPDLRDRLAFYYYNNAGNFVMVQRPAYREHVRAIIPIGTQFYIWDNCFHSSDSVGQELLDCPSPMQPARISELVHRISSDEDLMGELTFWVSSLHVAMLIAENQIKSASQLKQDITVQLEKHSRTSTQ